MWVLTKVFIVMNVGKFLPKFPKEIMQEKKIIFNKCNRTISLLQLEIWGDLKLVSLGWTLDQQNWLVKILIKTY